MLRIVIEFAVAVALTAFLALMLGSAASRAQTSGPNGAKTSEPADAQLPPEEDLYILKDVPQPAPDAPQFDLGKVGKKGQLSLERMPLDSDGEYDTKPRGAGGIRLKIPLGKQAQ